MLVVPPLQNVDADGVATPTGVPFTVTVIVNGAPTQVPVTDVGVTVYITVPEPDPAIERTSFIVAPEPEAVNPVGAPVPTTPVHAKEDATVEFNVMPVALPVHIDFAYGPVPITPVPLAEPTGIGFTVIVAVPVLEQLP